MHEQFKKLVETTVIDPAYAWIAPPSTVLEHEDIEDSLVNSDPDSM